MHLQISKIIFFLKTNVFKALKIIKRSELYHIKILTIEGEILAGTLDFIDETKSNPYFVAQYHVNINYLYNQYE